MLKVHFDCEKPRKGKRQKVGQMEAEIKVSRIGMATQNCLTARLLSGLVSLVILDAISTEYMLFCYV